jgi:hypothetical protein
MLKLLLGKRLVFTATRGKIGTMAGNMQEMKVCITDVKFKNKVIKDHAWINWDKRMEKIPKDKRFEFTATVTQYLSLNENYEQVMKYKFDKVRSVIELA